MAIPGTRNDGTGGAAAAVGNVVRGVNTSVRSGVKGIATPSRSRTRSAASPRGGKTGTAGGGPAAGPGTQQPAGTGASGNIPVPPLSSRSLAGALTLPQLQSSLAPASNAAWYAVGNDDRRKRRGRSY